jgi:hypothetical protein
MTKKKVTRGATGLPGEGAPSAARAAAEAAPFKRARACKACLLTERRTHKIGDQGFTTRELADLAKCTILAMRQRLMVMTPLRALALGSNRR